jgi:hypothetical protein
MRMNTNKLLVALTLLTLAAPVWARPRTATAFVNDPATIGGTQLKPGEYQLKVENNANQLEVLQKGKVVAVVPVQWIQLPAKPAATQVTVDNNQITEVDFGGDIQAVQITANK